jgi:hypothetical protein
MPFLKRREKQDVATGSVADGQRSTPISNTKQRLTIEVYAQIAEELHRLEWQWPEKRVARAWEIQRHFGHSVGLVVDKKTAYRFFYCTDCRMTLVMNYGHQGRQVRRQLRLPIR